MNKTITTQIENCLLKNKKITFLVGAGISAESGIPTFRGEGGYWVIGSKNYRAQEIATKQFYTTNPYDVLSFYLYRYSVTHAALPNPSHYMLTEIEEMIEDNFALITQNVDGLHKKAGSSIERTYPIHGDTDFMRCGSDCTDKLFPFPKGIILKGRGKDQMDENDKKYLNCPECGELLRPNVLWFDEYYTEKNYRSDSALKIADETGLLFIIGTSGETNLPNQIASNVLSNRNIVVDVNIEESSFSRAIQKHGGISVISKSSPFLVELKEVIHSIISNLNK